MGRHEAAGPGPSATADPGVRVVAGGASLTAAAHEAGFADSAHFSRTFRRMFGVAAAALKGKRIGVQRSTIQDRFATATFTQSEIVRYAKADEVYLDLAAGRVDVVLSDTVAVDGGFLKKPQGKGFAFFGPNYDDPKIFGTGSGIAVRKADAALQAKFNAAIPAIRANGVYKKINDKYFDFDVYGK